jgi:hypothetical protein
MVLAAYLIVHTANPEKLQSMEEPSAQLSVISILQIRLKEVSIDADSLLSACSQIEQIVGKVHGIKTLPLIFKARNPAAIINREQQIFSKARIVLKVTDSSLEEILDMVAELAGCGCDIENQFIVFTPVETPHGSIPVRTFMWSKHWSSLLGVEMPEEPSLITKLLSKWSANVLVVSTDKGRGLLFVKGKNRDLDYVEALLKLSNAGLLRERQ